MKHKFEVELDLDEIKKAMQEEAVRRTVSDYFNANDLQIGPNEDWGKHNDRRRQVASDRLKTVVGQVDWDKLPEIMKSKMAEDFMKRFINFRMD